jgi:cytosine/adenosine deaminase-related metal-dependent hydrolase
MTLRNLRTIDDQHIDLHLGSSHANWDLSFDGALVMPGLVNSHDHLEFNLYPQLGDRQYRN